MSCSIWEEQVALLAGDDLEAAEAAAVERHLSQCADCRALAEDLRGNLQGLRVAHAEPLPAAQYAAVRARVLAELERPPLAVWAWAAGLAVAAAAALLVLMRPAAVPAPNLARLEAKAPVARRPVTGLAGENSPRTGNSGVRSARPLARQQGCGTSAFACQPARQQRCGTGVAVLAPVPDSACQPVPPALSFADLTTLPGPGVHDLVAAEVAAAPEVEAPVRMVQLATDDPNVVIYWQLEETEESGGEK